MAQTKTSPCHRCTRHVLTPVQSNTDKIRVFHHHLQQKCAGIDVDHLAVQLLCGVHARLNEHAHYGFQKAITEEELWVEIRSGKRNKGPGHDGIPTDFYQLMWPNIKADLTKIIDDMLSAETLHKSLMRSVVVSSQQRWNLCRRRNTGC